MKNIKGVVPAFFTMLLIVLIPKFSIAEHRMITYEMGDGAYQVSFPMSQKEILEAEKIEKLIKEINQRKSSTKNRWVEVHEFSESGETVEFPMSDDEIIETKLMFQKLLDLRSAIIQKENKKQYEIFEMGESGHTVIFEK